MVIEILSKLSNLVLGLLWKKSLNPYEITKLMERPGIQDWFPMNVSSIYTTIKNLHKKGYITGEIQDEGNRKTIYTLTEKGEKALKDSLELGLESFNVQATHFGTSLFHICILDKDEAIKLLEKRIMGLEGIKFKATERVSKSSLKLPFNFKMMQKSNIERIKTEIKITSELIDEIKAEDQWNSSFIDFMQ
ncbi:PadR family transcriptional regulator [Methanobacterium spitsbergense]|uniref:PadR family transcriptional regulator n=1 Tax=Methanobacterium spitsbergense TaxID=2874285 RepID=UPI001CBF3A50